MHLWSAAAQQVDQSRVERHDGVAHVNDFSSFLTRTVTHRVLFFLQIKSCRKVDNRMQNFNNQVFAH